MADEDLYRLLLGYRQQLAAVWSDATIHPSYLGEPSAGRPISRGQCGVSSAWILWKLGERFRSMTEATYCYGDVVDGGTGETFEFHCWLEFGSSAERLVVDVTCDQFKVLHDTPVLFERHDRLMDRLIEYRADSRRSFDELSEDHVWERFETLRQLTAPVAEPELATLSAPTG
ncbi:hypothetical protein [Kribbella sp. NPDC006257]|uniref:hypothetical protein n=1 Tax=Kribbella sp. NPDC006257 TaxID=3156738 RepID=UPI0033AEC451